MVLFSNTNCSTCRSEKKTCGCESTWLTLTDGTQAGSEFNTPRSENNTSFRSNAKEKAATRDGQRGAQKFYQ
eukprot:COSAG02_NODE_1139_length_14295_cov_63.689279_6_plen_72_part_00